MNPASASNAGLFATFGPTDNLSAAATTPLWLFPRVKPAKAVSPLRSATALHTSTVRQPCFGRFFESALFLCILSP